MNTRNTGPENNLIFTIEQVYFIKVSLEYLLFSSRRWFDVSKYTLIIEREVCRLEASVIYIELYQPLKYVIRKKTNIRRIMTYHVTFEYFLRILPEPTENVIDENLIVHRLTC